MRIRTLDGLRALSIGLVLMDHALDALYRGRELPVVLARWGQIGTSTFFALSGYLITLLLLKEQRRTGGIDLKAFFVRRAFRILPPVWVFLAAAVVLGPDIGAREVSRVFFFVVDYAPTHRWWLDHTWSLAVTEQFYLLWPLVLWLLPPRGALKVTWALLLAAPAVRLAAHAAGIPGQLGTAFHTILDAPIIGCLLALLHELEPEHRLLRALRRPAMAAAALVYLLGAQPLLLHRFGGAYHATVGLTVRAFAVASIVCWCIAGERGPIRRLLATRPLTEVGLMSYSLYLWQQPFFDPSMHLSSPRTIPLAILGSLVAARLSYLYLEKPFVQLRARWVRAPAPAPRELAAAAAAPEGAAAVPAAPRGRDGGYGCPAS